MATFDRASIDRSAALIREAIGSPADLTLVRCVRGRGSDLAAAGLRTLLADREYREIELEQLAAAHGHTALLLAGGFSRAYHDIMPRALAVAELRFERVIVLPSSFDPSEDTVREALARSRATVFAAEPESLRQIAPLCAAELAHDCAFFFDFSPYRQSADGVLEAFRTDREATPGLSLAPDNDDISRSAPDLEAWLKTIAVHGTVRTDRARVLIAAALIGKRVEYAPGGYHRVGSIAQHWLSASAVAPIELPVAGARGMVLRPAAFSAETEAVLDRLKAEAAAHPPPSGADATTCRVTAVMLTRDRPELVLRALDSLAEAPTPVRTIVIDNNSTPRLAEALADACAATPATELRRMEENLGCAGGRRLGTELAETELVLFMDDDAELLPGALEHLVAELDQHPEAGAVTATVVRPDGTIFHSGGAVTVTEDMVSFELLGDGEPFVGAELPPSGPSGWTPGTAFLARRALLEEFPIDQTMRGYFEDNEWCYRIGQRRPEAFRRSRGALVVHHASPKHAPEQDFAARSATVQLLSSYARFFELHGRLLGPWLFDHVPGLRGEDGSRDAGAARVLMELVMAKGTDWVFAAWMNGDLSSLLGNAERVRALRLLNQELEAQRAEVNRLRARAAQDAHTISSLDAALNAANRRYARVESSVTWQLFQRTRGRVFGLLGGEESRGAQAIQRSLRYIGRRTRGGGAIAPGTTSMPGTSKRPSTGSVRLPRFDRPEVSIVIPLYSRADLTRAALESIHEHTDLVSYEVILVDDAADQGTKELLGKVHGARQIVNEQNLGYLRSMQKGAAAARGRWLVLCNNDIEVRPGWLAALIDCAESDPEVAIVAPKFLYPDGLLAEAGGIIWQDGTGANYGRGGDPSLCHYDYRREIDYGSAAALMVRADFWTEVGGFDERFLPMYYEDTDLCFEARARGLKVMYEPAARIVHYEGATAGVDISAGHKRHQEENRPKFVEKWRERLEAEHLPNDPASLWLAANLRRTPHVLVVDHRVPPWDRESGALRMRGILESLVRLGCQVTFLPDNLNPHQPYTRELQRLGVEVLYGLELPGELEHICSSQSLVILSRPQVAGRWLELVRQHAPAAKVLYDTVDLHWLREARREAPAGATDPTAFLSPKVAAMRELELGLIRAADGTIVVSETERRQVLADVSDADIHVLPNVNPIRAQVPPAGGRTGLLFVGGFEHPPNVEAALTLVQDVMPLVWREVPEVHVTIAGGDPPPEIEALISPRVDVAGWVPDLEPLLGSARALVAPLRYGAGLKGKVTQALAAGLPVVTTPIGAEGLGAVDGQQLLIGTSPEELAHRVTRVVREDALWERLSRAGQSLAAELCSPEVMEARLAELVAEVRSPERLPVA